jgi:two-component system, OmpR family, sensor histidine kinase PhoQ
MTSLKRQFLIHSALVTVIVMAISMVIVDFSYRSELTKSSYEQLRLHIYGLLSVAQHEKGQLYLPAIQTNPRFNTADSGLWAAALDQEHQTVWQSLSLESPPNDLQFNQKTGSWLAQEYLSKDESFFVLSYKVAWENDHETRVFYFVAAENEQFYLSELTAFRSWLFGGFLLVTLGLLLFQHLVLRRSFRPIAEMEDEITAMEHGLQSSLEKDYPTELSGVTKNLNLLIEKEHRQREKYRESMADLAHSLKTPLSVIRGELHETPGFANNNTLQSAIERIDQSIEYQLRRAVISGHTLLSQGTQISEVLDDILEVLQKAYADTPKQLSCDIATNTYFMGDENDLFEILGNLLDNAFKYAQLTIKVSAWQHDTSFGLSVEDDGPGIKGSEAEKILLRGARLDSQGLGQGIGLAVVKNIVSSYDGEISVLNSSLGGAKFVLTFPFQEQNT